MQARQPLTTPAGAGALRGLSTPPPSAAGQPAPDVAKAGHVSLDTGSLVIAGGLPPANTGPPP